MGIFSQPDSIVPEPKNPQALNRYSYAYGNPVRSHDPTGHARADYWRLSLEAPGGLGGGGDWLGPLIAFIALAVKVGADLAAVLGALVESRTNRGPRPIRQEFPLPELPGQLEHREGLERMFRLAHGASLLPPHDGGKKGPKYSWALWFLGILTAGGYMAAARMGQTPEEHEPEEPPSPGPHPRAGKGPFIIMSADSPEVQGWMSEWQSAHPGEKFSMDEFDNWAWSLYFLQTNGRGPSQEDWEKHYNDQDYFEP